MMVNTSSQWYQSTLKSVTPFLVRYGEEGVFHLMLAVISEM